MDHVRPLTSGIQVSTAKLALAVVGLLGLAAGLSWSIATSNLGRAVLAIGVLAWRLVPPGLWLGAGLCVLLWLVVLRSAWRSDGLMNRRRR